MQEPELSVDELIEHDSNPDTDTDTYNHRYDEEGNCEPFVDEDDG